MCQNRPAAEEQRRIVGRVLMKSLKLVVVVAWLCLTPPSVVQPIQAASPVLGILKTELQRNFSVLNKEQTPAYFMGYTVHDERSSTLIASG